jgi:hypothetical protein
MEVKRDAGWLVFYDGKTQKELNHPRERPQSARTSYYQRAAQNPPPAAQVNPLDAPHQLNYTAFRARKPAFTAPEPAEREQKPSYRRDIDPPQLHNFKYVKGSDPSKNPFRVSQLLVNKEIMAEAEREMREQRKCPKTARVRLSSRRGEKTKKEVREPKEPPGFSLYVRSLKQRDDTPYEWPRDFYRFQLDYS